MTRRSSTAYGVAAVRGAVPVPANTPDDIRNATARLLRAVMETNRLERDQVVSALFTVTEDLDADFPAHAARRLGWTDVPLLNAREVPVPGAMPRIVRVLITVGGVRPGTRLTPVYLDQAAALRPDLENAAGASSRDAAATARVALIGLGQVGGSIGLALGRAGGWRRTGFDLDRRTATAALRGGAVDEVAPSLEAACADAALAVLATPVDTLPRLVAAVAAALPRGAGLVDTGSARGPVTPALRRAAARGVRAVGGHPLAGSEGRGFAAARADLFVGATFVLCPVARGVPRIVRAMLRDLGARPLVVDPRLHDRALARTSHLPYLLARALAGLGAVAARRGLSGPGFRSMTRLAASDPRMAEAFCRANATDIARAWRELRPAVDRAVRGLGTLRR